MLTDRADDRLPWVDVLRGLSILAVVLLHINIRIPFGQSAPGSHLPRAISRVVFASGFYGVKVFFVVSGFLITTTIFRRWQTLSDVNVGRFYRFRFARIAPCLLALLALLSALHYGHVNGFVVTRTTLGRALVAALTFHVNQLEIAVGYLPATWDVLWSLSVEEVFYGAYPLLLRFIRAPRLLVAGSIALVIAGPFARTVWAQTDMAGDYAYLAGFDCIALGCLAAAVVRFCPLGPRPRSLVISAGAALMLLIVVFRGTANQLHLGRLGLDVTVLAVGTALFLWGIASPIEYRHEAKMAWSSAIRWLGRHSYEIYLTHSFVTVVGLQLYQALGSPRRTIPLWHVAMVLLCAFIGWLVARFFSEPANRYFRQGAGAESKVPSLQLVNT
ncbi:MAG TPA: acyltransferase [Vicinamibacterales bacterium]